MEWGYRDRMGFPDWHLECLAIALNTLGDKPENATLFCIKELEFNKSTGLHPCFFIYKAILKSAYLSANASSIFLPVFSKYFLTR